VHEVNRLLESLFEQLRLLIHFGFERKALSELVVLVSDLRKPSVLQATFAAVDDIDEQVVPYLPFTDISNTPEFSLLDLVLLASLKVPSG
jgi:hypothetical protein